MKQISITQPADRCSAELIGIALFQILSGLASMLPPVFWWGPPLSPTLKNSRAELARGSDQEAFGAALNCPSLGRLLYQLLSMSGEIWGTGRVLKISFKPPFEGGTHR